MTGSATRRQACTWRATVSTVVLATVWHVTATNVVAQVPEWLTGEAFGRQLALPVSVQWEGRPLREGLDRLAESVAPPARLAYVLDRRVDPGQPLSLNISQVPLREALSRIAAALDLEVTLLDSVVYIGPPVATRRLRTLAALRKEEVDKLPASARQALFSEAASTWDFLSVPREILDKSAEQAGIELANLDAIPHDLWPEISLPPLSLVDRWTLVLNQFDLTFRVAPDGNRVLLTGIDPPVTLARRYPTRQNEAQIRNAIERAAPDASVESSAGALVVRGRLEDHERIAAALAGTVESPTSTPPMLATRYTLTVKNESLARVMESLRQRLGVSFQLDTDALRRAGISTDELVTLEVRQATLDELLTSLFEPVGLTFRRDGQTVHVGPVE